MANQKDAATREERGAVSHDGKSGKSFVALIKELRNELLSLIHQEMALARKETAEHIRAAAQSAGVLAGAAAAGLIGLVVLVIGICAAFAQALHALGLSWPFAIWVAFVGVGAVIMIVVGIFSAKALRVFKRNTPPVPHKAIRPFKKEE